MIVNPNKAKRNHNKSTKSDVVCSSNSILEEMQQIALEIQKYYPSVLQDKEDFLTHLSKYIKAAILEYVRCHPIAS